MKCDDIVEIIHKNSTNNVIYTIYPDNNINNANLHLLSLNKVDIVLDLHGVLDTVTQNKMISYDSSIVCCSFVGKHSKNRISARKEISERILSGQILWGVLIFQRKRNRKNIYKICHKDGSKAWFCKLVKAKYFLDDSIDHVESVETIDNSVTEAYHVEDNFMEIMDKIC